jgi:hypothetical protein
MDFDIVLGLRERILHILTHKDIAVEILTEDLCGLIADQVLRVNHDDILYAQFEEGVTHLLGVTGVYEDQLGEGLQVSNDLLDLLWLDELEDTEGRAGVLLEFQEAFGVAMRNDVQDLGLRVTDHVLERLTGGDFAAHGGHGFVGGLHRRAGTSRAVLSRDISDRKSTAGMVGFRFSSLKSG